MLRTISPYVRLGGMSGSGSGSVTCWIVGGGLKHEIGCFVRGCEGFLRNPVEKQPFCALSNARQFSMWCCWFLLGKWREIRRKLTTLPRNHRHWHKRIEGLDCKASQTWQMKCYQVNKSSLSHATLSTPLDENHGMASTIANQNQIKNQQSQNVNSKIETRICDNRLKIITNEHMSKQIRRVLSTSRHASRTM